MSIRLPGRCVVWLQEKCISSVHETDRQIVVSDYNAFAFQNVRYTHMAPLSVHSPPPMSKMVGVFFKRQRQTHHPGIFVILMLSIELFCSFNYLFIGDTQPLLCLSNY